MTQLYLALLSLTLSLSSFSPLSLSFIGSASGFLNLSLLLESHKSWMDMQVVIKTMDFDYNGSRSASPYLSAPATPKRFGEYYFGSPASPRQLPEFYLDFDDFSVTSISASAVPFDWEEKPGTPKSPKANSRYEDEFAFDVGDELEKKILPAEELFDGGKIRQLKPPPHLQLRRESPAMSPRSPISNLRGAFSPRKKKDLDPFATAVENTREKTEHERGRERVPSVSSSSSGRRGTRSISPRRVSKYPWEEEQQLQQNTKQSPIISKPTLSSTTSTLSSSSSKGHRKWRLKDFFLFRSASEGRAADKDPLKKYTAAFKKHEDVKNSSFRAIEGSNSGPNSKRKGQVSAHELHYTVNRAVSENLKKKTFLPYKQGILGRLSFNPAVHAVANGFGKSKCGSVGQQMYTAEG